MWLELGSEVTRSGSDGDGVVLARQTGRKCTKIYQYLSLEVKLNFLLAFCVVFCFLLLFFFLPRTTLLSSGGKMLHLEPRPLAASFACFEVLFPLVEPPNKRETHSGGGQPPVGRREPAERGG